MVAPLLGGQLASFIDNIPGYVTRLQAVVSDPSRPWLQKIIGEGLNTDKSMSDLMTQGVGWLTRVSALLVVGRPGAGFAVLAGRRRAGGRVLSHLRLAPHDRDSGRLGAGAPPRHRAPAGARNRRRDFRLCARADRCLPDPWLVLCGRAHGCGPELWHADRPGLGADHLRPLCRLVDRPGSVARRCGRAVLAGVDVDCHGAGDLRRRPVYRRQCAWRPSWSAKASASIRCG